VPEGDEKEYGAKIIFKEIVATGKKLSKTKQEQPADLRR
jgi:hypothetical protein